jgi:hypothetical protein
MRHLLDPQAQPLQASQKPQQALPSRDEVRAIPVSGLGQASALGKMAGTGRAGRGFCHPVGQLPTSTELSFWRARAMRLFR